MESVCRARTFCAVVILTEREVRYIFVSGVGGAVGEYGFTGRAYSVTLCAESGAVTWVSQIVT